jgi:hypothetical protein
MTRRDPPSIAVWALEHLTSGERDEALAGDILETFQSGCSNSWYWRQALMACAVSWSESFRKRASLLIFALLWAMAAPGWDAFCRMADLDTHLSRFSTNLGPFWVLLYLAAWTILHSVFLWAGLLLFGVFHTSLGGSLHPAKFKRAFLLVSLILAPAYFAMFVVVALYWYPTFAHLRPQGSPLQQMVDVRLLADVIRIPYLLALAGALWGAVRRSGWARIAQSEPWADVFSDDSEDRISISAPVSFIARHFFASMVAVGLLNALIAGVVVSRLTETHALSLPSLGIRALLCVLAGLLAGAGGTYFYWKHPASPFSRQEPLPFPLFALICAAGWVWVPVTFLLCEQGSPVFPFVAMIGAFVLTSGVRHLLAAAYALAPSPVAASEHYEANLFADSLSTAPVEPYGYLVALSLYAGAIALCLRWYATAALLLVLVASVVAWKTSLPLEQSVCRALEYKRAAVRLARIAVLALLVTFWALLDGVVHRSPPAEAAAGNRTHFGTSSKRNGDRSAHPGTASFGADGYQSVILWPYPDKQPVLPPIVAENSLLPSGTKVPLVIRFNGPYWYLQPPLTSPTPSAHVATGTPIGFDIRSSNFVPLTMEAHQYLSASIPIARCREIAVDIENRDNTSGKISLGIVLAAGASTKEPTLYLGEQPILSTQPGNFSIKSSPVFETLRFSIPARARMRKFREITVLIFSDTEHSFDAPKIAIQQFQLYPR